MIQFGPLPIAGTWSRGYALDLHTISSTLVGYDEAGHKEFETTRPPLGELLYSIKYKADKSGVPKVGAEAAAFLRKWKPGIDIIVPVPPSKYRAFQPVQALAEDIGKRLSLPVIFCIKKQRSAHELKNVTDFDERTRLLAGLYTVDASKTKGKRVLLFDDLYRSGATMSAIADLVRKTGGAADVFALTITRTRSNH